MAEIKLVHVPGHKPIRILKWLVKKGESIQHGTPLAAYRTIEEPSKQIDPKGMQLKSKYVGTVKKFFMQEGQVAISGGILLEIENCAHPVVIKDMCAECGQDLRPSHEQNRIQPVRKTHSAKVAMIPNIPELRISAKEAEEIALQDKNRLHKMRKLVLLVDLDQTLIHTTQDPGLAALCQSSKGFYSFQLNKNEPVLFTKLRPFCQDFLEEVSKRYELQIVTFGSRQYAHKIADFIDKEKKYFAHRILSRDECIHPFKKSGNLRHLFPCGDSMVCIIDDRDDVWNAVPNLIVVRKYNYFQGTGDINNPYRDRDKDPKIEGSTKRKSEEMIGDNNSKRAKEDDGPESKKDSDVAIGNAKKKEKAQEESKSDVDEDLDMSSDSDSSSDSTSESSSSDNSEDLKQTDGVKSAEAPSGGTAASCKSGQTEMNKSNGTDPEGQGSSAETLPISSQESAVTNSQDLLDHEASGFSNSSQEFSSLRLSQNTGASQTLHDSDDYLQFLKDILVQIHNTYYEAYDKFLKKEFADLPDVRGVVPFLRSKVLYGQTIVFTGVIPQAFHAPPSRHRAYIVARQLGAKIEEQVNDETTHLVASKKGTSKYQDAQNRKEQKIKMVSVDWLWCCSERWEHVDEKLFPIPNKPVESLSSNNSDIPANIDPKINRPPANSNPAEVKTYDPATGKLIRKVKDPRFDFMVAESQMRQLEHTPLYSSLQIQDAVVPLRPKKINPPKNMRMRHIPLTKSNTSPGYAAGKRTRKRSMAEVMGYQYSLSTDDIADMDKEVDDLMESSDEDEGDTSQLSRQTLPTVIPDLKGEEDLGTLVSEFPVTGDPKSEKDSDSDDGEESSEDDEMEALLNAEMHFVEEERSDGNLT